MSLSPGAQIWLCRSKHGAEAVAKDPQACYEACIEYFQWCEQNPVLEERVGFSKGRAVRAIVPHPRAFTLWGLSIFLGISTDTWFIWRKERESHRAVISWAEAAMKEQKFTAAASGLMNANLIAREMGLADKQIHEGVTPSMVIKGPDGEVIEQPPIQGE